MRFQCSFLCFSTRAGLTLLRLRSFAKVLPLRAVFRRPRFLFSFAPQTLFHGGLHCLTASGSGSVTTACSNSLLEDEFFFLGVLVAFFFDAEDRVCRELAFFDEERVFLRDESESLLLEDLERVLMVAEDSGAED